MDTASEFSQICASQNDLFALDKAGHVYQYNFTAKVWEKLGATRTLDGHERGDRGKRNGPPAALVTIVLALTALLTLVAARPVDAEVPTAADFAACNEQAPRTIKAGAAAPTTGDHRRADSARGGIDFTATVVASPDPQIHGMDASGARNPEYQAAYRSCMRRKGF